MLPCVSRRRDDPGSVWSVGHGTASEQELLDRLAPASVRLLVDVRTAPGSRRHPHLGRDRLQEWLPAAGVDYRWEPRLGGFRRPEPDNPDCLWRNDSFRGYAGHLRSPDAVEALAALADDAGRGPTAFMCSETLWWRCHRRLVSDALVLLHGLQVQHLLPGRPTVHVPTEGVRVTADGMVYDGADPVAALARWQAAGGSWRVLADGADGVEVALLTCDGGEQVDAVASSAPGLRAWLREHESP
jgi:hypothetical protein